MMPNGTAPTYAADSPAAWGYNPPNNGKSPVSQILLLDRWESRLHAAAAETDYCGLPAPVWRTWCDAVLDLICAVRLGDVDHQRAFRFLQESAKRYFQTDDLNTRRQCQVALKVFKRATEILR